MRIKPLKLKEVLLIEPEVHNDKRGYFLILHNKEKLKNENLNVNFVQDSLVCSNRGVVRGLHYQISPYQQSKIVSVLDGEIFDVIVDFRKNSKSYLKWISIYLSSKNKKQIFIPKGFLHGYQVISKTALVHYKISSKYSISHERVIKFDDKKLNIKWPINKKFLSKRDLQGKQIK